MSHENRSRVTVELGAVSPLYPKPHLPGWEYAGIVSAGADKGPLVRNTRTGVYAMSIGGAIRSLDQRKIRAAIGPAAKKLDGSKAAELGAGNVLSILRDARESVRYHKGMQDLGHEAGKRHAADLAALIERIDAALAAPEADLSSHPLVAALCDLSYRAGLKAGWNYCADDDPDGFARSMETAREAVAVLNEHRQNRGKA